MNAANAIDRLCVVGAGTMGHGIAQVAALSGFRVTLVDQDAAALKRAQERIDENLAGGIQRGKLTPADRERVHAQLSVASDLAQAASGADLAIEAIFENLEAKRSVFTTLARAAPPHAILATNT